MPLVNPPVIDVCDLNFVGTSLKTLPSEEVFDQTALEQSIDAIDRDYCAERDLPRGERVPIATVLQHPDGM